MDHKTHVARLSNLARTTLPASSPPSGGSDDEEEDPEEIAFRERLRKLAEEEDDAVVSDPFGLEAAERAASSSIYADDKLSADAQRAIDLLRRASMAVTDDDVTSGRPSVWHDENHDEDEEAVFKAQQARLKALTAAAQPGAAHVRTQLTRANMPKPPGLVDPDQQRRIQERQMRLSIAQTAAVVAATGVSADEAKEIKTHIDQVVKTKVAAADRFSSPKGKSAIAPPPGLAHVKPSAPHFAGAHAAPSKPAGPAITEVAVPQETKRSSMVAARKSVSGSSGSVSASPERAPSRKSMTGMATAASEKLPSKQVSTASIPQIVKLKSTSTVTKEDAVDILGVASISRGFFDIMTWRTPVNSCAWVVFAAVFTAVAFSRSWSTLTVWTLTALVRVIVLRVTNLGEAKLPSKLANIFLPKDSSRLPGSLNFLGDALCLVAALLRVVAGEIGHNTPLVAGVLGAVVVIGFKLNIAITMAITLCVSSLALAGYKAVPQAFAPLISGSPKIKSTLDSL